MSEAAHGTIKAQRTRRRPGNSSFRSWAMPSEPAMVTTTIATTQISVLATTVTSASCSRRRV